MLSAEAIRSLILDGPYAGRKVSEASVPDCDVPLLLVESSGDERFRVWQYFRGLLAETGRWPIFTASWAEPLADELAWPFPEQGVGRQQLAERARSLSVESAVEGIFTDSDPVWKYVDQGVFDEAAERVGETLTLAEAREALGLQASEIDLERWLFDWEEARSPGLGHGLDDTNYSYEPGEGQPTALVLLPTNTSWESLAYLSFWGAQGVGDPERAMAILRSWHDRFGAEIWATYSTMLEFVVEHPPTSTDESWPLAIEQHRLAPCTNHLAGVTVRDSARWLVGQDRCHLHERP